MSNGSPVSGKTVTLSWRDGLMPAETHNVTTGSNGVATQYILTMNTITVTATYESASTTCTVINEPLL